jgi:hypothetical protein
MATLITKQEIWKRRIGYYMTLIFEQCMGRLEKDIGIPWVEITVRILTQSIRRSLEQKCSHVARYPINSSQALRTRASYGSAKPDSFGDRRRRRNFVLLCFRPPCHSVSHCLPYVEE